MQTNSSVSITKVGKIEVEKLTITADPQKKKIKFKIDPIENISFDGDYEETELESDSEQASSEEESIKRSHRKTPKSPKKVVKIDRPHMVINVSGISLSFTIEDTKYPVVRFVGKKIYNWVLQNESEATNWDIFWTDNAVQPEQLGRM